MSRDAFSRGRAEVAPPPMKRNNRPGRDRTNMGSQSGAPGGAEVIHPYVERRSEVQGGRPVIKGSRFPVSSVVLNHRRGLSVDEILREFPELTPAEVYDSLSYYYDHRERIDAEIESLSRIDLAARDYPPTLRPGDDGNQDLP